MPTKEGRVQTAFILSIIGSTGVDPLLLFFITPYNYFGFSFFSSAIMAIIAMPLFAAPCVIGGIGLYLIKDTSANALTGKYRVFYILSRVFSIIAIVEGAILASIGLIYILVNIGA